jgi:hypothetical protein
MDHRISRKKVKATNNHKSLKEVGPNIKTIKDILKIIMIPLIKISIHIPKIKIIAECKKPTLKIKIVLVMEKLVKNIKIKMIILISRNRWKVDHKDN